jgi:hypothetical protein
MKREEELIGRYEAEKNELLALERKRRLSRRQQTQERKERTAVREPHGKKEKADQRGHSIGSGFIFSLTSDLFLFDS